MRTYNNPLRKKMPSGQEEKLNLVSRGWVFSSTSGKPFALVSELNAFPKAESLAPLRISNPPLGVDPSARSEMARVAGQGVVRDQRQLRGSNPGCGAVSGIFGFSSPYTGRCSGEW